MSEKFVGPEISGQRTAIPPGGPSVVYPGAFGDKLSDKDRAEQLRSQLRPLLDQIGEILTQAQREGRIVSFNLAADQYGIHRVASLNVLRPL